VKTASVFLGDTGRKIFVGGGSAAAAELLCRGKAAAEVPVSLLSG